MNKTPLSRRFASAPWGLLGMLGLVLAVELGVSWHEVDFSSATDWIWRIDRRALSGKEAQAEILLLGDSVMRGGLSPLILREKLGRSVRSIAPSGCSAAAQYYMLKRILGRGIRPRAVVVDYLPRLLQDRPQFDARCWAELLNVREALGLARTVADPDVFSAYLLNRLVPTIRDRYDLRTYVREKLAGVWWNRRFPLTVLEWHARRNLGAQVLQNVAGIPPVEDGVPIYRRQYETPFHCHAINELYVRRMMALAEEHEIPVYWLLAPVLPSIQREAERVGDDTRFGEFVARIASDYRNLVVLDGRSSGYDSSTFNDSTHLSVRGNARLSVDVGECLAHSLERGDSSSRWVVLPRFRPAAEEAMLEDYQKSLELRSRAAVAQKGVAATRRR